MVQIFLPKFILPELFPHPHKTVLNLQFWAGEQVNYSCKAGQKLFQTSNESGLAIITAQCFQFGHLRPWWFPATLPACLANLTENTTVITSQYEIGNFFFIRS
jgi:hypothetical protein